MRRGAAVYLAMLLIVFVFPSIGLAQEDEWVSIEQGHYIGRDSFPGEHAQEPERLRSGVTMHTARASFQKGNNEGNITKMWTLLGCDVYRIGFPSAFSYSTVRFVYHPVYRRGWVIFVQQPNIHLHDDGGIYRLRTRLVKTLDEHEAEVWRARLEQNFPENYA